MLVAAAALAAAVGCSSAGDGTPGATGTAGQAGTSTAPAGSITPSSSPPPNVPAGALTHPVLIASGPTIVLLEPGGSQREIVNLGDDGNLAAFPSLSPDGATIAFLRRISFSGVGTEDWGDDILLVPLAGGEPTVLREHPERGQQVSGLAWRPDGDALLYGAVDIGLNANGLPVSFDGADIVELAIAGGEERTVVEGALDPSLSASGDHLAYLGFSGIVGDSPVMVADGDGSDPRPLADTDRFEVIATPRVSPDGSYVAFAAAARLLAAPAGGTPGWLVALLGPLLPDRAEAHGIPMDVWVVDATSGEITQLTAIGADDPFPAWFPNGQAITFMAGNGIYEVAFGDASLTRVGEGLVGAQITLAP